MKRHSYRIRIEVEHFSRGECIKKFEDMVFKLKVADWPEGGEAIAGGYPMPTTNTDVGAIAPSVLDRLARIEQEIEIRLGGLSEDTA